MKNEPFLLIKVFMEIKDKVIVITGAAQGLGKNFALDLANRGAKLALADINQELLDQVRKTCEQAGTEARAYDLNVAEEKAVEGFFDQAVSDFGTVDVLINNAGITRDGLIARSKDGEIKKMSLANWQAVIDVNLTGSFLCGREFFVKLLEHKKPGVCINISSLSRSGNLGQSNYTATKAGVAEMTVTWAKEMARHGIRVAAIAPGYILNTAAITSPKMASTIVRAMNRMDRNRMRVRGASTRPAMSPTVWPRLRMETTSEPKSCTAPIRMEPNKTQRRAGTHPQMTASAGPTIGPVPAIEVKW